MPLVMANKRKLFSILLPVLLAAVAAAESSVTDCKDLGYVICWKQHIHSFSSLTVGKHNL